jgi:hypothetical protein
LKSCSRPTWLSFVRDHFPALTADYERRFAHADFADPAYRDRMALTILQLCARHGLGRRSSDALLTRDAYEPPPPVRKGPSSVPAFAQASLFAAS